MSAFRRMFALAVVCLASLSGAQVSDQVAAERVLGPHWRQIARTAQIVFSGTVLSVESQSAGKGRPLALIVTKFRVDRAIVNVKPGQVLKVREWVGAWDTHRAMTRGERLLLFFYAPSKLRLTSPVGGRMGQVLLDARGEIAAGDNAWIHPVREPERTSAAEAAINSAAFTARLKSCPPERLGSTADPGAVGESQQDMVRPITDSPVTFADCVIPARIGTPLDQLVRAIRQARKNLKARIAAQIEE